MRSEPLLAIVVAAEFGALSWAVTRPRLDWLRPIAILNMVLITLFAEKLMSICGMVTNVGNVFYAAVCVAQILTVERQGEQDAGLNIPRVLFAVGFILTFALLLAAFPAVAGNEEFSFALARVIHLSPVTVAASFFAFITSQVALIKSYTCHPRSNLFLRFGLSAILCQVVDSAVFFPIAFQSVRVDMIRIATIGCLLKIAIMMLCFPLVWVGHRRCSHDHY